MHFAHDAYLWVMGFTHVTLLECMTCFMSFDWLRDMAQLTRTSEMMDFTL